jgi:hypothetical protein
MMPEIATYYESNEEASYRYNSWKMTRRRASSNQHKEAHQVSQWYKRKQINSAGGRARAVDRYVPVRFGSWELDRIEIEQSGDAVLRNYDCVLWMM